MADPEIPSPMKKWTVRMKDGTTYTGVLAPTAEAAKQKMLKGPQGALAPKPEPAPTGPGGYKIVPPGTPVGQMPSPLQVMGQGLKQNWPDILAMGATMGVGGNLGAAMTKPLVSPLARMLVGGGVKTAAQAGQNALQGTEKSPLAEGGKYAAGQALGETVLGGAKFAANPFLKNKFVRDTMGKLGTYLHEKIPALAKYPANEVGVRTMFYTQRGTNTIHEMYDKSLADVITRGKGKMVTVPQEAAEAFGLPVPKDLTAGLPDSLKAALSKAGRLPPEALQTGVQVDAGKLAAAMTGQWNKYPGEYRSAANALDTAGIGDPIARAGYKTWAGLRKYFDMTGSFQGRQFQPEKAAAGFDKMKPLDQLLRRQIGDEVANILSPGRYPIEKSTLAKAGTMAGAVGGALAGGTTYPGIGHLGGAAGGSYLGNRVGKLFPHYTNVPIPQTADFLSRLGAAGTGVAARKAVETSTGD